MRNVAVGLQSQYLLWQVEMPQWIVCVGITVWLRGWPKWRDNQLP